MKNLKELKELNENKEVETWVQLYDFIYYQVSNLGRIKSIDRQVSIGIKNGIECFRHKPQNFLGLRRSAKEPHLFTSIWITNDGVQKNTTVYIHRAVADHFVKKTAKQKKHEKNGGHLYATHIVKDYDNNRWDNVKFITHKQLMKLQPKRRENPKKHWETRRKLYGSTGTPQKKHKQDGI